MANVQAQFGFKHVGYLSGGAPDYQQSTYAIQKTNSTAIGFGDPVCKVNATSPYIQQPTAAQSTGTPLVGIFVGCVFTPSSGLAIPQWSPFWPGSTVAADATAYVIDAPNAKFLVATFQTAILTGQIGQCVGYTTGVPSTVGGGFSIATVDQSTVTSSGTTAQALPFKIVGLYPGVGNGSDPTTNFNWVEVVFNQQQFRILG